MKSRSRRKKNARGKRHPAWLILPAMLLAVGLSDCPKKAPPQEGKEPGKPAAGEEKKADDPAVSDLPLNPARKVDPARLPKAPAKAPVRVATRYILLKFQGAESAPNATRLRPDARKRAERLVQIARKQGQDFVELARAHSEVPEADRGTQTIFGKGTMMPAFEKAAFGMGVGHISDAVETDYGFYVILREEPLEFSTAHILVQYKEAKRAPSAVSRSKEEAKERAEKVRGYATKPKANFAVLAERYSDSPSRLRGGVIRPIVPGQMPADYDNYVEAIQTLKVGDVAPVVETPFGFHVIKRLKLERISASHILIAWNDSEGEPRERRSKGEARQLAVKVLRKARAADADFAKLAKEYSDDLDSADKGGDLGSFARGMLEPKFEQMAFGLKVGRTSDLVKTKFGWHIIRRTR